MRACKAPGASWLVAVMAESSGRGTFRQRAINTANLLLQAADRLETSSSNGRRSSSLTPLSTGQSIDNASERVEARGVGRPQSPRNREQEMRSLFNWTARTAIGTGKRTKGSGIATAKSKKKKAVTWTHTFICLAQPDDDTVPDSRDRATLKLAGIGEKKFAVELYCTGQEFYDDLLFQYPKLREGGGYELLRVPEGGGRELEIIKVPEGGYNAEYLRAVVHSAKIFIRPLQKALDNQPQTSEVSKNVIHIGYDCAYALINELISLSKCLNEFNSGLDHI